MCDSVRFESLRRHCGQLPLSSVGEKSCAPLVLCRFFFEFMSNLVLYRCLCVCVCSRVRGFEATPKPSHCLSIFQYEQPFIIPCVRMCVIQGRLERLRDIGHRSLPRAVDYDDAAGDYIDAMVRKGCHVFVFERLQKLCFFSDLYSHAQLALLCIGWYHLVAVIHEFSIPEAHARDPFPHPRGQYTGSSLVPIRWLTREFTVLRAQRWKCQCQWELVSSDRP